MFYHLPNPIIYAFLVRLCYFLMEHCVRKQCFMFYHFLTQFHVPRIKLRLIIGTPFCHGTTMFYVLCFTIYLTWYSMPIGHGYAIFDWTFCHETMFYVLPFTWPDSLYFLTFTFEGRIYLATMIYVLCITICHLKKSIHLVTSLKLGLDFGTTFCHEIMLYVLPSTWPMPLHHLIFWWNILVWNNVLCFTIYLSQFAIASRPSIYYFLMKPNPLRQ